MSILGNDISTYQGEPIDFQKMKAAGCQFLYIRLGVGWNKDARFDQNRKGAKEAGIPWGCYWLPWDSSNTGNLLKNYADMVGGDWGDLPPAIDVELEGTGLPLYIYWLNYTEPLWIKHIGDDAPAIRKKLTFYTRASFFNTLTNTNNYKQELGQRTNLWVAHYTYDPAKKPIMPKDSWADYLIHQYSADENSLGATYGVKSKAIDMNYLNGSADDYIEWAGLGEYEEPDPPVPPEPQPQYVRVIAKQVGGQPGWLFFRSRPEIYSGDGVAVGYGVKLKLLSPDPINGMWHVTIDDFEGYVSAGTKYTERA